MNDCITFERICHSPLYNMWQVNNLIGEWTEGDLNPRLPRCERGDHTRLIYRPV